MRYCCILVFLVFFGILPASANADSSAVAPRRPDYQIHLKAPAREIRHIMYERNFLPIQGTLSEDKKSVVLKELEKGQKVRVKVVYEDGTEEEFVKSPCFIDPVIL